MHVMKQSEVNTILVLSASLLPFDKTQHIKFLIKKCKHFPHGSQTKVARPSPAWEGSQGVSPWDVPGRDGLATFSFAIIFISLGLSCFMKTSCKYIFVLLFILFNFSEKNKARKVTYVSYLSKT